MIALVGVVVAAVAVGWSASQNVPDLIQTKAIEIVNDQGDVVAGMASGDDGGMIHVRNTAGQTVAALGADEDGGLMTIRNAEGKTAVLLASAEGGQGMVQLNNPATDNTKVY